MRTLGPVLALLVVLTGAAVLAAPAQASGAAQAAQGAAASRCRVAAHRGDHSGDATENGMRAMRRAAALGVEVLEGDVRATSDDGLVMMHDRSVRRTTTARGFVDRLTARRVRAIRLLDGNPVPALWQVLRLARTTDREALVELKRMGTWRSYRRLATLVERFGVDHVVVQSRVPARLERIRRLVPAVRTALVTAQPLPAEQVAAAGGVVVERHAVTDAWLDTLAGASVYVWTVDDADGWARFGPRSTVVTDDSRGFITARSSFCP